MRLEFEVRGLELKRPKCLEWAVSSAAVAAWAERALGFSARASAIFAAAEASSSVMEASKSWANCASPWRRWWCSLVASSVAQRLAFISASRSPASTVV